MKKDWKKEKKEKKEKKKKREEIKEGEDRIDLRLRRSPWRKKKNRTWW